MVWGLRPFVFLRCSIVDEVHRWDRRRPPIIQVVVSLLGRGLLHRRRIQVRCQAGISRQWLLQLLQSCRRLPRVLVPPHAPTTLRWAYFSCFISCSWHVWLIGVLFPLIAMYGIVLSLINGYCWEVVLLLLLLLLIVLISLTHYQSPRNNSQCYKHTHTNKNKPKTAKVCFTYLRSTIVGNISSVSSAS